MKRAAVPPPLHVPSSSGDLARMVSEAIEEVEVDGEAPGPFSPSRVAQQLSRIGQEFLAEQELRDELLSPEAWAQIPRPPT